MKMGLRSVHGDGWSVELSGRNGRRSVGGRGVRCWVEEQGPTSVMVLLCGCGVGDAGDDVGGFIVVLLLRGCEGDAGDDGGFILLHERLTVGLIHVLQLE